MYSSNFGSKIFSSDNALYVFGGETTTTFTTSKELWSYNYVTNSWNLLSNAGAIGSRSRTASWRSIDGNLLYTFGGLGFSTNATAGFGYLNDLWMFNISSSSWSFITGANSTNATQTSDALPSPRAEMATFSIENNGSQLVFIFGGYGFNSTGSVGMFSNTIFGNS